MLSIQTETPPASAAVELGAVALPGGRWSFCVWAPQAGQVELRLLAPRERTVRLERDERGYHVAQLDGVGAGDRYLYRIDGGPERPDPVSRFQPQGVHGPSEVVDHRTHLWGDGGWRGLPLEEYVLYEAHVGTYTREGTFEAIIPFLDELRDLGVNALELMPVAQFPGNRNWGYDGAQPFAVQQSYGGPEGLKRLVEACHARDLALVLDVVYNHLGPEGNYLGDFGPYFTDRYRTPWGTALNFDGSGSDEVRRFFIENALGWFEDFHVDMLRLDAIHGITDTSARPFLAELSAAVDAYRERCGRRIHLIAESDLNDARILASRASGGAGLDGQWSDDFHHALHSLLTGERHGYYEDFGTLDDLAAALRDGFVYDGRYSPHRHRRHGSSSRAISPGRLIVCAQNHDQVGNRAGGDRLSALVPFEGLKLAAGAVLLSPCVPLLFMGEEYGETAPFRYFTSHGDPQLIEAVRAGRKREFAAFCWEGEIPDPQAEESFLCSRLDHDLRRGGIHRQLLEYYRELLRLRREGRAFGCCSREQLHVETLAGARGVWLLRRAQGGESAVVLHFGEAAASAPLTLPAGSWRTLLDSADRRWGGPGSAHPSEVRSSGEVRLGLAPFSVLALGRDGGGNG